MKKLIAVLFIFIFGMAKGQTYPNGWIDYSKTYYKFKVGINGLYHITQSTLNTLGLSNIPAEQFQLWRNGQQVSIYTNVSTGPLPANGFIEFWGLMNDGKPDTKLYINPDYQMSDHFSLQTDTAAYFLTVNPSGNNLRFLDNPNNTAGNTLSPEPYFMNVLGNYYKTQISPGYAAIVGTYIYSSSYDIGEGWVSTDIYPANPFSAGFSNINLYSGGPGFSLKFAAAGNADNTRNIRVKIFNSIVDDETMSSFSYLKKNLTNLPLSLLSDPNNVQVSFINTSSEPTDRMNVSFDEITYPSKFIFNNLPNFYFQLPATSKGNYLVISQFDFGTVAPVLFDLNSNKRYLGDISTPGNIKFVLPPSSDTLRKFQLASEDAGQIINVTNFEKRNFVNYGTASNQGNYLIISNPLLYTSTTGSNNVDLYRQYRASSAGGGYNAKLIDINELVDQFAYGIKKHPSSVKDFVQYATNTFTIKPQYLFLIGKGIQYDEYSINQNSMYADRLNLVPTFGAPASDIELVSPYGSLVPSIPVGRLSVVSGDEVGNYLQKLEEYELEEKSTIQTEANKLWMKNVVNIVGGTDSSENDLFSYYMNNYKAIVEDTLFGADVATFSKSSSAAVQQISSQQINNLFSTGINLLAYFGHSSANLLEFNLSDPTEYNNQGKYPFFVVSGCTAGNNYIYDTLRIIQNSLTISENFVLAKERGSIGFLASSHLGIPPYLNNYNVQLFNQISNIKYGNSIGIDMQNSIRNLGGNDPNIFTPDYYFTRIHLEELALHGDPAVTINPQPKPDYVIEDANVVVNPQFISVSQSNFTLQATAYNIGKAINDSITFQVTRTYPDGTTAIILRKRIQGIYYSDSIDISIPIVPTRDKGDNKLTVTIDADNNVVESSETNNSITKDFFIYEDDASPVYPADFAIVNVSNQKLYASTSNPVSAAKNYVFELDTTALFNSSSLISKTINQTGGYIEFDPGITYKDNTVYYWRVAVNTGTNSPVDYHWNGASFVYLASGGGGSNQSHYFQQLASDTLNIHLNDSSRLWQFAPVLDVLESRNGIYPTAASAGSDCTGGINEVNFASGICPNGINNVLIFNVVNPITLQPWMNSSTGPGLNGSLSVCADNRIPNFAFDVSSASGRKTAMKFMDSIPNNYLVYVRNVSGPDSSNSVYANAWQADTAVFGNENTLYQRLKSQGFVLIDSFNRPRAFAFIFQKNNPNISGFEFTKGISDIVDFTLNFYTSDTIGYITSPKFGPALAWKEMHWRGTSLEKNSADNPSVQIIGVDSSGNSTSLMNLNKNQQDVDISSIKASRFPYIQLKMRNIDSVTFTPYQLTYWRLNYQTPPEGAISPNLFFSSKDTLQQGEILHFGIAFKNISVTAFDSVKVKLTVLDKNNVTHVLSVPRQKPLIAGDSITLRYDLDTKNYPGLNTLFVDFNPDNDQPEQYLFNNFLYQNFYVVTDNYNPTLDVTFDGVHILNEDIVSAKPHIIIKLKDENKSLALNDTSLLNVQVQNPDGSLHTYHFDNDTMRFTPANLSTGQNTATIDLTPTFTGADDEYELVVSGKDASGNPAGNMAYRVDFRVISKPMISNLMNYPNPFTTSTAFVFTVTGSQIPQNMRIQILTITGKIIREITEEELGPIHVGRNITDFKWDGSDMYGQKVANGVYLYRVLTNLNGKKMDKFTDQGDNTDKYFTKGYGKMYFMR